MPTYPSDNPQPPNPTPIWPGPGGAISNNTGVQSPAGTVSTAAAVMMGLGAGSPAFVVTPLSTGRLAVEVQGTIANNTASDGAQIRLRWGFGAAPANGAAQTGTGFSAIGNLVNNASTAALVVPFNLAGIITGLTIGVPIWIDVGLQVVTGGTASIANVSMTANEF